MKLLPILILSFVLAGCSMSVEEYNARVKYCKDNGLDFVVYKNVGNKPQTVDCKDSSGNNFDSKEK